MSGPGITSTRKLRMAWNDGLSGTHLNIAAYLGTPLRVIAGPGTGKTYALMRRVARLLENGIDPTHILAVTFTRTAAKDLVDKLAALGVPGAKQVVAKTLHALSFSILHSNSVLQATGRHPRPLLQHELSMLICDLKKEFGGKRKVEALIKAFEAYWAQLQHQEPGWPIDTVERDFDNALRDWLQFHHAMLVGEVIPQTLAFIRDNPEATEVPKFTHVLVDEYQDLNRADQALIDALSETTAEITVIGDEDQSVYSFRYAHPEGIAHYDRSHTNTHDEVLEECRRCPGIIVDMATALIQRNTRTRNTVLTSRAENSPGKVAIVQHSSLDDESDAIASFIDKYLDEHPDVDPGQVLVLATRRVIGYGIRNRLNIVANKHERKWRAQSFFLEDCLESLTAKEGFTLLALLVDPEDRAALRAWLGLGDKDGRTTGYSRVMRYCSESGLSPRKAFQALADGSLEIPHTASLVQRFSDLEKKVATIQVLKGAVLIDSIFPSTDGDCEEIRSVATQALAKSDDVEELLENIRTLVTQPELPDDHSQTVRVMSLHKSKGLTSKVVVIAGCVAGALPSLDPKSPPLQQKNREQEQRRLFYVALTRTTETLVISSAVRMKSTEAYQMGLPIVKRIGNDAILAASSFLAELGNSRPATQNGKSWRAEGGF